MLLSIEPDAIKFPVGSNLAVKISPVCPDSSITGACNALVLVFCLRPSASLVDNPWRDATNRLHQGTTRRI